MKNIAIILSGCGVMDGSEINEVILTLLALEEQGLSYHCFAPDMMQYHVINHLTGKEMEPQRNVLQEAARIVRGKIKPLTECRAEEFAALILPGGFGVAKNLSTLFSKGADFELQKEVLAVCQAFKGKPTGYICIAPALLPKIYGPGVELTLGKDNDSIQMAEQAGARHTEADFDEIVFDAANKVVSTPAFMRAITLVEAKKGIDKLVAKIKTLI